MDHRNKATHNGRTNRDSTSALTTVERFPAYFCDATVANGRDYLAAIENIHLISRLTELALAINPCNIAFAPMIITAAHPRRRIICAVGTYDRR